MPWPATAVSISGSDRKPFLKREIKIIKTHTMRVPSPPSSHSILWHTSTSGQKKGELHHYVDAKLRALTALLTVILPVMLLKVLMFSSCSDYGCFLQNPATRTVDSLCPITALQLRSWNLSSSFCFLTLLLTITLRILRTQVMRWSSFSW